MTDLTDFNDLHVTRGIDAVRVQMLAVLAEPVTQPPPAPPDLPATAPPPPDLTSPHPAGAVFRFGLPELLQRFALAMPDGKIWDARDSRVLKQGAARAWWGAKLYAQWLESEQRGTVMQEDVIALAAAAQARGRGGLSDALNRYFYIYPTDSAWDVARRERVPISALKLAIADIYESWIKHPQRRDINTDDLVFDPTGPLQQNGRINTFRGLPMEPIYDDEKCSYIIALVHHLVNGEYDVFRFLMRWLAYPLQRVGAKMASAVLAHSSIQGSGKSLLFEEVMKPLYGEYGGTLGQHQLESQYTDWRSQMLFALFEEIFSGSTKFSHTGQLKQMITGKTQRIEKKFVSGWEEANHLNAVFLSNETQPFPIDPTDRRMLVIWPEKKLPVPFRDALLEEIKAGGVAAFLGYLLRVDLGDHHSHTEPPMTEAKQRLIDYSRYSWDLFHNDWSAGRTPWPYQTCLVEDLYVCYTRWCSRTGERDLTLNKFSNNLSTRERRRKDVHYMSGGYGDPKKGTFLQIGAPPDGKSQQQWFGESAKSFRDRVDSNNG